MDDWPAIRRRALAFLVGIVVGAVLLVLWPELVGGQSAAPYVRASWQGQQLLVEFAGAGCLYLVGGGRGDALIEQAGQNFCNTSGSVLLPTGGISADYAPQLRTHVVLLQNRTTLASAPIPPRIVRLPIIVAP